MTALTAWSYSRWADWSRCPMYFKAKYVDKSIVEEPSPQMERGDRVHKALAEFGRGNVNVVPAEAAPFTHLLDQLRHVQAEAVVQVEQQWGFTAKWEATDWFGKQTWFRAILDVCVVYPDGTADVVDYKTGKAHDDNRDQMELFGLSVLARYPDVSQVLTRLWYLDAGQEALAGFGRSEDMVLRAKWNARAAEMFADREFLPRPNDKCRWCPLRRSNGGMCRYG